MSDDLDDLKSMMQAATPKPDATRRAENLAMAQKNFETFQGSVNEARPKSSTIWNGVQNMLTFITSRGGLTATTALVACGFLITPAGQDLWRGIPETAASNIGSELVVGSQSRNAEFRQSSRVEPAVVSEAPAPASPIVTTKESDALYDSAAVSQGVVQERALNDQFSLGLEAADIVVTPSPVIDSIATPEPNSESYPEASNNPLKITAETPVSTFSIDVDTASYSVVRSSILNGYLPPADAVRVEEMVNYFPYNYAAPETGDAPFLPTVSAMQTPWNPDTQLVQIALQGQMPEVDARPPLNLVFLIDTSGSMSDQNKLPLLRQSFMLMLDELRPEDQVAIVTYAGTAGMVLEPTPASEKGMIVAALARLSAGGSTNGQGGLEQAYAAAEAMSEDGEVSRVILATDGDFNVGVSDPDGLTAYVEKKRETGTYLSVLGFGRGNLHDDTMQALAQNGNGNAAYIDTLAEARKVLVDELTGALFTIAGDVKVQVEWNPAQVAEYRLIGFETRALNREDFNNDAVDAGELGAGHSVTALYEITPVGSPAQMTDPLRYQAETVAETSDELGFLRLRYKEPGESESKLIETPIFEGQAGNSEAQFAAAIAGFGQLLRGGDHLNGWTFADAAALAKANKGEDPFGYRAEAVQLMQLANALSQ